MIWLFFLVYSSGLFLILSTYDYSNKPVQLESFLLLLAQVGNNMQATGVYYKFKTQVNKQSKVFVVSRWNNP